MATIAQVKDCQGESPEKQFKKNCKISEVQGNIFTQLSSVLFWEINETLNSHDSRFVNRNPKVVRKPNILLIVDDDRIKQSNLTQPNSPNQCLCPETNQRKIPSTKGQRE